MEFKRIVSLCLAGTAAILALTLLGVVHAQISLTSIGTQETVDFNSFTGDGAAPYHPSPTPNIPGTLDTSAFAVGGMSDGNLPFDATEVSGDFARGISTGGVSTGGMYAFDLGGGNRALGFQPTDSDMTPGILMARIDNNTGEPITAIEVSYDVVVYNDEGRSTSWAFSWATAEIGPYTEISELELITTEAADPIPSYSTTGHRVRIHGFTVANGGSFYLRWVTDDVGGAGSRDEIGIDNLSLRGTQTLLVDGFESGNTDSWSSDVG
jgi:hypothetical protein